jgi:hypothetical protein
MNESKPTSSADIIVEEILGDLTLREKHEIAQMDLDDMDILESILGLYLDAHGVSAAGLNVIEKVWQRVRESHRLKVVK